MKWSLSEFLLLLEIRSQCWCFVDLGMDAGFNIPHNDTIMFYGLIDGEATITGIPGGAINLKPGDIAMIPGGDAHAIRTHHQSKVEVFEFLCANEYIDTPPSFRIGSSQLGARLLCSRMKVRWPAGQRPEALPALLRIPAANAIVSVEVLERLAKNNGAAAVLTRAASLLFTAAFRDYHDCDTLFRESYKQDPISRAKQFIELHPFTDWTVESLARKVLMGRSNFAARFATVVGKTPIEYVNEERMKHAAKLLQQTDLKIIAISEQVGYRSEAAFSRRFSAYYGVSPGKMRKSMQGKKQGTQLGGSSDTQPPPASETRTAVDTERQAFRARERTALRHLNNHR